MCLVCGEVSGDGIQHISYPTSRPQRKTRQIKFTKRVKVSVGHAFSQSCSVYHAQATDLASIGASLSSTLQQIILGLCFHTAVIISDNVTRGRSFGRRRCSSGWRVWGYLWCHPCVGRGGGPGWQGWTVSGGVET